ncbi:hypothetical protein DH2020_045753 [Rehmannia glutinosa]|uniref:Uncharacterized protein n=1 Tax=Rehmannia glutinosa TaxID=99300 RepID=A0ABR0UE66_REHGL
MSFFQQNMLTNLSSNFDEQQWVKQIRQTLDEELEEETHEIPITIFTVPKAIMLTSPDSYIPQQISIGPYHHFRAGVYDMERYKVAATKRNQKELQNVKFQDFVNHLITFELRVRASYQRPVTLGPEALAWMMAVDACFLFEFFQVCGVKKGKVLTKTPSRLANLIDLSGNKTAHNAILRDIVLLENQIPLFVMRMLLEFQFSSLDLADELLLDMLIGLSGEISPFKIVGGPQKIAIKEPLEWIKTIIFSKPLKLILQLPWTILTKIPIIKMMKGPIENMLSTFKTDKEKTDEDKSSSNSNNKPPLLEEIKIPSVTQLFEVGVKFLPTNEGITSINFDEKNLTFYIPIIELDVNSKVVLRNLVAYEACSASGPLILTRFVELMNGIIDTDEDAKLLCQRGIVINHLKSEKEVADLWNGMSKSVRLTKVPCLDKVIGDVNKYYNGRWKVKVGNFMKKYVFGSWRILTFLAAIMMLLLMCLQAFCQVYSCSRVFPIKALEPMNQS